MSRDDAERSNDDASISGHRTSDPRVIAAELAARDERIAELERELLVAHERLRAQLLTEVDLQARMAVGVGHALASSLVAASTNLALAHESLLAAKAADVELVEDARGALAETVALVQALRTLGNPIAREDIDLERWLRAVVAVSGSAAARRVIIVWTIEPELPEVRPPPPAVARCVADLFAAAAAAVPSERCTVELHLHAADEHVLVRIAPRTEESWVERLGTRLLDYQAVLGHRLDLTQLPTSAILRLTSGGTPVAGIRRRPVPVP